MVRWGLLGLGRAAQTFISAIKEVDNAKLIAVASLSNLEKFNFKNELRFKTYNNLINFRDIDAVYIATLNNKHANLIMKCARADKAILCEKPMSISLSEAINVHDYLEKNKILFLENIAYRSHPQTKQIIDLILNNEIGDIKKIQSSYGFHVNQLLKFKPNHRLFNKKFGGGAINDIGCYPVSLAILLIKLIKNEKNIDKYKIIKTKIDNNFRGTDDESYLKINFDNSFDAEFTISIKKKLINSTIIHGTKGKIIIDNPWLPENRELIKLYKNGKFYEIKIYSKLSLYANTISEVSKSIKMNKKICDHPNMSLYESFMCSKILFDWKNFDNNRFK
jgi:predicted dehydrogenase